LILGHSGLESSFRGNLERKMFANTFDRKLHRLRSQTAEKSFPNLMMEHLPTCCSICSMCGVDKAPLLKLTTTFGDASLHVKTHIIECQTTHGYGMFLLAAGDVVDRVVEVPQPYTVVRLVSSGWSYNSVSIRYQQLLTGEDYE